MSRTHGWVPKPRYHTPGAGVTQEQWDKIFGKKWWCTVHNREATHTDKDGAHRCDPVLGGIMMPCRSISLDESERRE